jgi:hypothetical protein
MLIVAGTIIMGFAVWLTLSKQSDDGRESDNEHDRAVKRERNWYGS